MINLILTLLGLCGLLGALLWLALGRVKRLQNKLTDAERTIAAQNRVLEAARERAEIDYHVERLDEAAVIGELQKQGDLRDVSIRAPVAKSGLQHRMTGK